MNRLRSQVAAQKDIAKDQTIGYLDKSLAQTQQERFLRSQQLTRERDAELMRNMNSAATPMLSASEKSLRYGKDTDDIMGNRRRPLAEDAYELEQQRAMLSKSLGNPDCKCVP